MDTKNNYQSFLIQYHAGIARDLPILSPFAHDLARQPRARLPSIAHLTRAFQTDPFLAAKLTGASNSVFFAPDRLDVLTIPEALKRVGTRYAMNLVWEAPPLPLGLAHADLALLWAHCMAVAHVAKSIATHVTDAPFAPEAAHLIGMIHDIGYVLQLSYSPNTWGDIALRLNREECEADNGPHELQGEELAKFWSLPTAAVAAIKAHHEPHTCEDVHVRWLATVLAIGEKLLRRSTSPAQITSGAWTGESLRRELRVSGEVLAQARTEALQVWKDCMELGHRPDALKSPPRLQLIRTGASDE